MSHHDWAVDCKVYVGGLGYGAEVREIEEAFSPYGTLKNVWVARNPPGFAFVEFADPRDATDACRLLDGTKINGRRVRVELSTGKQKQGFSGSRENNTISCRHHNSMDSLRSNSWSRSPSASRTRSRSRSKRKRHVARGRTRSRSSSADSYLSNWSRDARTQRYYSEDSRSNSRSRTRSRSKSLSGKCPHKRHRESRRRTSSRSRSPERKKSRKKSSKKFKKRKYRRKSVSLTGSRSRSRSPVTVHKYSSPLSSPSITGDSSVSSSSESLACDIHTKKSMTIEETPTKTMTDRESTEKETCSCHCHSSQKSTTTTSTQTDVIPNQIIPDVSDGHESSNPIGTCPTTVLDDLQSICSPTNATFTKDCHLTSEVGNCQNSVEKKAINDEHAKPEVHRDDGYGSSPSEQPRETTETL